MEITEKALSLLYGAEILHEALVDEVPVSYSAPEPEKKLSPELQSAVDALAARLEFDDGAS